MAHDVFISYSSQDKAVADAVCATLEGRKIRCWIAPRDVLAGQPYAESILNGINKSRVFVLVFSSDSNLSQQVLREVERAVSKGIPIFLSATHWLDALTPPLEGHLQKLADNVEALLGVEVPPKSETELPVKIKNKGAARKSKVKPLYIIAGIVVVALCVFGVLQLTGAFKGSKSEPKINSSTSVIGSTSTGLPGNTPTPLSTSTSTITTTSTKSNPPITTATGVIDSSGQLSSGVSTTGVLNKGETKWYYFSAEAGDAVFAVFAVLTKADNSASMQPWLELLGPDGAVITGSYGSTSYTIDRAITKAGKHTLRVRDYANIGGSYVLSFMQLSKSVNPLTSGVSLQGQLKIPGDVNWYTFDAGEGDAVNAVLSEGDNSAAMQPWLELLGPDGSVITGSYGSVSYTIDRAIAKAGKYTLRVRDYANKGGNYVLSFNLTKKS
ncbi:MAG: TIR domain-containing protein [Dehalococcoidales bacterium]